MFWYEWVVYQRYVTPVTVEMTFVVRWTFFIHDVDVKLQVVTTMLTRKHDRTAHNFV